MQYTEIYKIYRNIQKYTEIYRNTQKYTKYTKYTQAQYTQVKCHKYNLYGCKKRTLMETSYSNIKF